jgi:nucleotide-binding universal stress UspA family protein
LFRDILVPHDFSPHADAALALAIELAAASKGRIHLMHVFGIPVEMLSPYEVPMPMPLVEAVRDAATTRLDAVLARVRAAGVAADAEVEAGPIAEAITQRAAALGADLIAMGTRGLSGIQHFLLGSVAERVLRTARCPVLTTHAPPRPAGA